MHRVKSVSEEFLHEVKRLVILTFLGKHRNSMYGQVLVELKYFFTEHGCGGKQRVFGKSSSAAFFFLPSQTLLGVSCENAFECWKLSTIDTFFSSRCHIDVTCWLITARYSFDVWYPYIPTTYVQPLLTQRVHVIPFLLRIHVYHFPRLSRTWHAFDAILIFGRNLAPLRMIVPTPGSFSPIGLDV